MDKELATHAADVLKAVAHPLRLQIVELLEKHELCVGEIVEALGEKQSITSQQLTIMKDRGILASRREGARSIPTELRRAALKYQPGIPAAALLAGGAPRPPRSVRVHPPSSSWASTSAL